MKPYRNGSNQPIKIETLSRPTDHFRFKKNEIGRKMRNDIYPTEPCQNVIDPTPDGTRAIPRNDQLNRANRENARRAPDHNSLRANSRVKE